MFMGLGRLSDFQALQFRIADFAYSCDLSGIPSVSETAVSGVDVWILDALRPAPHPSHIGKQHRKFSRNPLMARLSRAAGVSLPDIGPALA